MRLTAHRTGLALLLLAIGCEDNPPTAVVSALATDSLTRDAVSFVRLVAERDGEVKYDEVFPVAAFERPGSITFQDSSDGDDRRQLRVRFEGYTSNPKETPDAVQKIRNTARLGFVKEKTKLLRLGLSHECLDVTCASADLTCRRGDCVKEQIDDPDALPDATSGNDGNTLDPTQFTDLPPETGGAAGAAGSAGQGGAGMSGSSGQTSAGQAGAAGDGGAAGEAGVAGAAGVAGVGGVAGQPGGGQGGAGEGGVAGMSGDSGQGGDGGAAGESGAAGSGGVLGPVEAVFQPAPLLAAGHDHTCVGLTNGKVLCWGNNIPDICPLGNAASSNMSPNNILGDGPSEMNSLPEVVLPAGQSVIKLRTSQVHTCALFSGGGVFCWGANNSAQLGLGNYNPYGCNTESTSKAKLIDLPDSPAIDVAAGSSHTCALLADGGVRCWGFSYQGRLGFAPGKDSVGNVPEDMGEALHRVDLGPDVQAVAIAAGEAHNCALLTTGDMKCWGDNSAGQLGLGDMTSRGLNPAMMGAVLPTVKLGEKVRAMALGKVFSCAILVNDRVKCWGSNQFGQLGQEIPTSESIGDSDGEMAALKPIDLGTTAKPVSISAGEFHVCVAFDDHTMRCWGSNFHGEAGVGTQKQSYGSEADTMGANLPQVDLGTQSAVVGIDVGRGHTCALFENGRVKCWGQNDFGQLGLGSNVAELGNSPDQMGDGLLFISLDGTVSTSSGNVPGMP